jgi:hypothetical protein
MKFGLRIENHGAPLDRLGGVRKEDGSRKPIPARDPVPSRLLEVATPVTPRGTILRSRERPADEFTIEEQRIQLAATAGPLRIFAARIFIATFFLDGTGGPSGKFSYSQQLVKAKTGPVFVRVSPATDAEGTRRFNFAQGGSADEEGAASIVLPDEGPFDCILMPDESLHATTDPDGAPGTKYRLKVHVVSV